MLGGRWAYPAEPRTSIVRRSLVVMKRLGVVLPGVLFTVLASACSGGERPVARSPVIYRSDDPSVYPLALMRGSLTLREGCLMLGEDVLIWPAGTAWESDTASVTFGGQFDGVPSLSVGDRVSLGGGVLGGSADVRNVLDDDEPARDALLACLAATGAKSASFVYPQQAS